MEDRIYRFRPIDRLLKADGISGELDSLYIYFASPEQLNDPLEGYKSIFFEGDEILWINLFKNYIRCFTYSLIYLKFSQDKKISLSGRVLNILGAAPPGTKHLFDQVVSRFFGEPAVQKFVAVIASSGRVTRHELYNYLDYMNSYAFEIITLELQKNGLMQPHEYITEATAAQHISYIEEFVRILSSEDLSLRSKQVIAELYFHRRQEQNLSNRLKLQQEKQRSDVAFEIFNFPDTYILALETSIHPTWYVACFMPKCDDSAIWAAYGGNHRDVCLEFKRERVEEVEGLSLATTRSHDADSLHRHYTFNKLHKVDYEQEFLEINFFESIGGQTWKALKENWFQSEDGFLSPQATDIRTNEAEWRKQYWKRLDTIATTKISDWSKECEFRILLIDQLQQFQDTSARKLKYKFDSLTGIVFGINTSFDDKLKIIEKIKLLCQEHQRSDFTFYQARFDHRAQKIVKDELRSINVGVPRFSAPKFP